MDYVLKFLTDYAQSLTYDKLPKEVVHEVKRHTVDAFGCALGAYNMIPPKAARAQALEATSKPGSTILGTDHRSTPELATFANGVMVRYLDFNDTSMSLGGGHPSDNIPAMLAVAEYAGADLKAAIMAVALAYETMDRFADACPVMGPRGWDYVTYELLSSAVGASKLLGLTQEQMANALSISVTGHIPLRQTRVGSLSMWKGCAAPNADRNGVFAALLARRGVTGPDEAFAGPNGFLKQLAGGPVELKPVFGGNGRRFKIQDAMLKYFPADYEAQCSVHPALEIRKAVNGQIEEIERIVVDTYFHAIEIAGDTRDKWNPKTRETADHSIPYIMAVAIAKGDVWLDAFTDESLKDPQVYSVMQKIELRENKEYTRAWPDSKYFHVEATTRSGKKHVAEVRYAKGHAKNPMSDAEIEAKFRRLAAPLMKPDRISTILERLWRLEEFHSVQEIMALFKL